MKKIFFAVTAFFMFAALPVSAYAQEDFKETDEPKVSQTKYPDHYDNYVNDFANVLTPQDAAAMRQSLNSVQQQTGIQVVVVTIDALENYSADHNPALTYASKLFDSWGIGDKTKNNGVLILFSMKDRWVRIEMGAGYSHRLDSRIQEIIDVNMVPQFKAGNYSQGLYDGTYAVINTVTKKVSWLEYNKWNIVLAVLFVVCVLAGISCMKSGKKGWGYAFFAVAGMILLFLLKSMLKGKGKGGFGGGRSGGGGGSGRW
jgi:uncharacterized protein